jgi:hypothetical protein
MRSLPGDPFALLPPVAFAAAARRTLPLFGAEVELLWLPERRHRRGRPIETRPACAPDFAARIIAEEALWRGAGVALTPNRHPFGPRQLVVWRDAFVREADAVLLDAGTALAERAGATLLVNSIGAAASIVRAHAHLLGERLPFLDGLALEPIASQAIEPPPDVALARAAAPYPSLLVAIHGPRAARVETALRLIQHRCVPAFSLLDDGTRTWFCPRTLEVPAPWFPQALGSAELWGRWCWDEEDAFRRVSSEDLARALGATGAPRAAAL